LELHRDSIVAAPARKPIAGLIYALHEIAAAITAARDLVGVRGERWREDR